MKIENIKKKLGNLPIFGFGHLYRSVAGKYHEFGNQMNELNIVIGENVEANECVHELIYWYRKEYEKRPEEYKGDAIVAKAIADAARTGLSFNLSLMEAYSKLKCDLALVDYMRVMG